MIEFVHDMQVILLESAGSDASIVRSAWASNGRERTAPSEKQTRKLIRKLMEKKHGSPLESGYLEFWIDAPAAVRNEHVRHRIGSYSSTSARYKEIPPRIYIPRRPLKKVEQYNSMEPEFMWFSFEEQRDYERLSAEIYEHTYEKIEQMKSLGFDSTEAIRWFNPDSLMIPYICRFNPRSLMHFLALRTHDPEANHVSYPMWEIAYVAEKIEDSFADLFPVTYEAFNDFGREAP